MATKKTVKKSVRKKPHRHLNCFLAKILESGADSKSLLAAGADVRAVDISSDSGVDGSLYIKVPGERAPSWYPMVKDLAGENIEELKNRSVSAVFLLNVGARVIAFTFGYGRFLLDLSKFEEDFGIKTALNTLESDSLRSVDLFTLDGEALQKRTQAPRSADVAAFGIDVSKDILKAVTGTPKKITGFTTVAGGEAMFSFGVRANATDLGTHASKLIDFYLLEDYKENFAWVDNVRRIRNSDEVAALDNEVVTALQDETRDDVSVVPPDLLSWDKVESFSFTRAKDDKRPTLEMQAYRDCIAEDAFTVEKIKRDRLFIFDSEGGEESYSVYQCLYFELTREEKGSAVLFGGHWYEVDRSFSGQVERTLKNIRVCDLSFDPIYFWKEDEKLKLEAEGDYNERACSTGAYYLLDKKLIKSSRTTTPIEFCDLLTTDGKLVHVKHRKGGSAGLSHLFAQGFVSAEVLLGDREFRKKARAKLRSVDASLSELVPLEKVNGRDFEVVFLILDDDSTDVRLSLPFFSKVNLVRTFEGLTQRGFAVSIRGVGRVSRPALTGSSPSLP